VKRAGFPAPLTALIDQLKRLPGIGPRGAERIAVWIARSADARPAALAEALSAVAERVRPCPRCGFFAEPDACAICGDPARAGGPICVVEQATDALAVERSGAFAGSYHVLGGRISPLDGVGPEDLGVPRLLERVREERPPEVILALGSDVEGDATAIYLAQMLAGAGAKVTRLAQGMPAGGGLEHAGELTLQRALGGRREV
jgi:recombination protein RecR